MQNRVPSRETLVQNIPLLPSGSAGVAPHAGSPHRLGKRATRSARSLATVSCLALLLMSGCIKKIALGSVADALSGSGGSFGSDNDPEFVSLATPFALKTMESVMAELPDHAPVRLAACSGYTQYAFAYLLSPATMTESTTQERRGRKRAKNMFVRANDYCLAALDILHEGAREQLKKNDPKALVHFSKEHVPYLYWTAASAALAITSLKEEVDRVSDLPLVEALLKRALALDPDYERGTLQEFVISFDGGRSVAMGGSPERARQAFKRAVELSEGKKAAPYVSLAESVSVAEQNRAEFETLLKKALAIDVDQALPYRLANLLAQERARYLLEHVDDLILE